MNGSIACAPPGWSANRRTFLPQVFCSHLEALIRQLYAEAERTKPLAVPTAAVHHAKAWLDESQVSLQLPSRGEPAQARLCSSCALVSCSSCFCSANRRAKNVLKASGGICSPFKHQNAEAEPVVCLFLFVSLQAFQQDSGHQQHVTSSVLSTGQLLLRCINSMSPCQWAPEAKVILSLLSVYSSSACLNLSSSVLRDTLLLIEQRSGVLPPSHQSTLVPHQQQDDPGLVAV